MSSMAKMLDGSAIATTSVEPVLLTGMTWYFCATSSGMSFTISWSTSWVERSMVGMPYWRLRKPVRSFSAIYPSLVRL